jgi:hypothetical protein
MRAVIDVVKASKDFIYLLDMCNVCDKSMTVTNDAEGVVKYLAEIYGITGRRIFYKDSLGNVDELLHDGDEFAGFRPGHDGFAEGDFL